ncbi:MAG: 50S ribosomal protein L21 [Syntrophobacteraceae bacterium]|nr:50S ribosomal protein L21 [Syntrophobacteraceae bacterium]
MYAIFKSGGRQYEAKPGAVIKLGKISGEVGENVTLNEVLFVSEGDQLRVGRPVVEGVAVKATIIEQGRGPKITIFKHKRRKDYRKKQGHRQDFTAVRVQDIG